MYPVLRLYDDGQKLVPPVTLGQIRCVFLSETESAPSA
jgi:hypothetical protein